MFGGLNKILDRNFIVGFGMPTVIFLIVCRALLSLFDLIPGFLKFDGVEPFKDTTLSALLALSISFLLMILNWPIFRFLEGYWRVALGEWEINVTYKWNGYSVKQWKKLQSKIDQLTKERDDCTAKGVAFTRRDERNRAIRKFATRFPSKEELVLPTKLGNAIRAFEDYPRVMYGIESITAWSRLNAVVPKDHRELIDQPRADLNFWMNMIFIDYALLIGYLILALHQRSMPLAWLVLPCLIVLPFLFSTEASISAIAWGEWVKGAFDIFLPELREKLGYSQPADRDQEREFWVGISQAITFRQKAALDGLKQFREGPKAPERVIVQLESDGSK